MTYVCVLGGGGGLVHVYVCVCVPSFRKEKKDKKSCYCLYFLLATVDFFNF